MINSVTYELDDCTIQICGSVILLWKGVADHEADITVPTCDLKHILSYSTQIKEHTVRNVNDRLSLLGEE